MADTKISGLTALTGANTASDDLLTIVDVSDTTMAATGTNKKITLTELQSAPVSAGTANGVLYLNGSKVATSGSALTFDGTNLGVGTASPVFSNSGTGLMVNGTTAGTVRVTQGGGTQAGEFRADANNITIGSRTNGSLIFEQFGSEKMRLTSTGLGIGTSSPAAKLVSAGSSATNFKALILRNGDGTTGSSASIDFEASTGTSGDEAAMAGRIAGIRTGAGTSGALTFSTTNSGTLGERARIDSSGNFLVGTTSTSSRFEAVAGTGAQDIARFRTGDATAANNAGGGFYANSSATAGSRYAYMWLDADGANFSGLDYFSIYKSGNSGGVEITNSSNSYMTFGTNNTERARIDSSGNLLVGTTSTPTSAVKVIAMGNATAPTASITGGILYVEAGALKFRGSSGTVTTIASA